MAGDFRVLGPVEVVGPAGPAALQGTRQRAVLGVLALHAGDVLPVSRLVDVLWGEDPPRTAAKTLHSHIARIRQAMAGCGAAPLLVTREPGYLLDAQRDLVDAHRFETMVRDASRQPPAEAAATLRAALALWRGDAFADTPLAGWGPREIDRLHELRLTAVEDRWEVELRLGNHEDAVRVLPHLLAAHPGRERLTGLAMLALYRDGRHTDALERFQQLRRHLVDEFGVDPGPEVTELHTAILRRDPALEPAGTTSAPAQLPAGVGHFTGRAAELAVLDRVLAGPEDPAPVVVSGTAGLGKTALALQWAHRVAARFPDGQLFIDLRGHDPTRAVSPADALAHLLRGLDVPDERIPGEPDEAAALYRSLVHGRRLLVMADNAGSAAQVLPLVPGSGPALLLVTSRTDLTALATRHAVTAIPLATMDHDESMALLVRVLGADRVAAEPAATAELVRLCGGLPLALRIAAARLGGAPDMRVAELVVAGREGGFELAGDASTVRAVLASAYHPLAGSRARMFRLLGTSPGATVHVGLAAALCGVPVAAAGAALADLAAAQLVTETEPGRVRFHDLVREFARHRADLDEPPADLASARERLVDWYLHVAATANAAIDPNRDLVTPVPRHPAPPSPFPADRHAALAFLAAERQNLLAVVQFAAEHGRQDAAWQLTYLLTSFYDTTGHWHERVELCRHGAAAASALGDPVATSEMLRALGVAYFMTRRLREALATGERALTAVRATGDLAAEGHVHNNLANVHAELRRFDDAVAAHRLAVRRCAEAGNQLGHALSQRNLGHTFVQMGRAEHSLPPLSEALATFRGLGNARLEAATLDTLGEAYLQRGEHGLALSHLDNAIAVSREIGDRWLEWETLLGAGRVHLARRDHAAAAAHFTQALRIAREVGDTHGEARTLNLLGRTRLDAGDLGAARAHLEQGMVVRSRVPDDYEQANLHRDLADLEDRTGHPDRARQHRDRAVELYRAAHALTEAETLTQQALTP